MTNKLRTRAQEGSTFIVRAEFFAKSSDGTVAIPVIPNEGLTWSLLNEDGEVINGRDEEPLTASEYVVIALYGDDLALLGNYPEMRYLVIKGTYDSILGSNLPFLDEVAFQIDDSVGVSHSEGL